MLTQEQLDNIELDNAEAREAITKGKAFEKLLNSDDYKLVISDGFLKEYPKELAVAIATNTGAYDTDALVEELKGINALVSYGFRVAGAHKAAEQTLADNAKLIASQDEE